MAAEFLVEAKSETTEWAFRLNGEKEVVRCKDCCYYRPDNPNDGYCDNLHKDVRDDWFCADGER